MPKPYSGGPKEAERRYYEKNREKRNAASSQYFKDNPEYKNQRRQVIRSYTRARKLELGCNKCGYREHHAALDWHHTEDDKEALVSRADSMAQADREMAKCIVLCANCHRVHHYQDSRDAIFVDPTEHNPILG